jgi:hypothetical protein
MFNSMNHQRNENHNHNKISCHPRQISCYQAVQKNAGNDMEKGKLLDMIGGENVH